MKERAYFEHQNFHEEKTQENCGFVAIYSNELTPNFDIAYSAALGVQHRGQHGAGVSLQTEHGLIRYAEDGLLEKVFTDEIIRNNNFNAPSKWMLIHCRYGTAGGYESKNLQPCTDNLNNPIIAVVHNGQFTAIDRFKNYLNEKIPDSASDTYIFTQLISQIKGNSWEEKIIKTLSLVDGSYSLAIGVLDKLYIARDRNGIRPLFIGKIEDGFIAASETYALDRIGAQFLRGVEKGEILRIDNGGITTLEINQGRQSSFCDLERAYFAHPHSLIPSKSAQTENEKFSFASFRRNSGRVIAQEILAKIYTGEINFDFSSNPIVTGVPDSGIYVAQGFAAEIGFEYLSLIMRDHFDPNGKQRTFMRDDKMAGIEGIIDGKLSIISDNTLEDQIVFIADDSVIRGKVSRKITGKIKEMGAKKVYCISGFPPVAFPCHLGVSLRTKEELIAYRNNSDSKKIAEEIGADGIYYISPEGFIKAGLISPKKFNKTKLQEVAINKPKNPREIFLANDGCGGCITGIYPVSKEGVVFDAKNIELQQVFYPR